MSDTGDILAQWRIILQERLEAESERRQFEKDRFSMEEPDRQTLAGTLTRRDSILEARLSAFRSMAAKRQSIIQGRLAVLYKRREALHAQAAAGGASAARLNARNRALQDEIASLAGAMNALARLCNAKSPEDLDALSTEDIQGLFSDRAPSVRPMPFGVRIAVISIALVTVMAVFLPWFQADAFAVTSTSLWSWGSAASGFNMPRLLPWLAMVLPILLAALFFRETARARWASLATALAILGMCAIAVYVRATETVPWRSVGDVIASSTFGLWLFSLAGVLLVGFASIRLLGGFVTLAESARAAAWVAGAAIVLAVVLVALRLVWPSGPALQVELSASADEPQKIVLAVTNRVEEQIVLSLPWVVGTDYGVRVYVEDAASNEFRLVEITPECWSQPGRPESNIDRIEIAPGLREEVQFDVSQLRSLGYDPERLRFALTDNSGNTVKAFQALVPR